MPHPEIEQLIQYLNAGSTPYHVVAETCRILKDNRFIQLSEEEPWQLEAGQSYFVTRAGTSLFAFSCPRHITAQSSLRLIGAHTDSPCLRLKPNASLFKDGYQRLNVEVYGSPILSTWLDRDLRFGGQLWFRRKGHAQLQHQIITSDIEVTIPNLAIHLQEKKENLPKINAQTEIQPIFGLDSGDTELQHYLESFLEPGDQLLQADLQLFDPQPARICGLNHEMITSGRLDDLCMAQAGLRALLLSKTSPVHLNGLFLFHNEEVGSLSYQGAKSLFAPQCIERVLQALNTPPEHIYGIRSRSLFLSADMAHAVHPAWEQKHDPSHRPHLNHGPVLKANANRSYATEVQGAAQITDLARSSGVSLQMFASRNDQPCGSTIGPALTAQLGISVVDIGNPMLAMHSIRETAGCQDHQSMITLFRAFLGQE